MTKRLNIFAALTGSLLVSHVALAGTKTFIGTGEIVRSELTMNLGNGETVFGARSSGLATISTEPPELLEVKCMGLGLISVQNETETDIYCTFRRGNDDAFDVKAKSTGKRGTAKVIGGSGRWKGATGSVTFKQLTTTETGGSFSYKMTISTP